MDDAPASLGHQIRTARRAQRIWQRDLAAAVGLSPGYLSELEHDTARATEPTLRRLAVALELPVDVFVVQAARDRRLAPRSGGRGRRETVPLAVPRVGIPPPHPRPVPTQPWLTAAEAATVIGITANAVRALIRQGTLEPVMRVHRAGEKGRPRWLVAREAVVAYHSPSEGYARALPPPVPAGYVSMAAFQAASGLSYGALHRRLERGDIRSEWVGRHRLIPEAELLRVRTDELDQA